MDKFRPDPEAPGRARWRVPGRAVMAALLLGACSTLTKCTAPPSLGAEERAQHYVEPLAPPPSGLRVFHLGHSLVGRDMPAMIEQLASAAGIAGHSYASQLGWGTSLREHWDPDLPINGFEVENDHPRFMEARAALQGGGFDAFVMTEMVELRDAVRYHDSGRFAGEWVRLARSERADMRVYLYESWHRLDVAEGWLERLDNDPAELWEGTILAQAMAQDGVGTIHVIPAGRVMAAFVRALEAQGGLPGMRDRTDLFLRDEQGVLDPIHLDDKGLYLVALVHFATLYHRDPRGLPHALLRADGTPVAPVSEAVAALMQETVWQVVSGLPQSGLPQSGWAPGD